LELLQKHYRVLVIDNFNNSKEEALLRVKKKAGDKGNNLIYYKLDLRDKQRLQEVFEAYTIDTVMHLAGVKAVAESVEKPLLYFDNNVGATVILLEVMKEYGVKKIIFSSSSTVYGEPEKVPVPETAPLRPKNPYGRSKMFVELVITDFCATYPGCQALLLRYFNPIGAHPSGRIGEDPRGVPNNLVPYVTQVAVGKRPFVQIFGTDYDTPDHTCIRDYIHIMDVAHGHIVALRYLFKQWQTQGTEAFNLGLGRGYSVLELIEEMRNVTGLPLPTKNMPRRAGDIPAYYCDPTKARQLMNWRARFSLNEMCRDAWNFQKQNPNGY